jgi:hypothetical protein
MALLYQGTERLSHRAFPQRRFLREPFDARVALAGVVVRGVAEGD